MRRKTMKGNKMASQFSSLLNEHWKRKQRLKHTPCQSIIEIEIHLTKKRLISLGLVSMIVAIVVTLFQCKVAPASGQSALNSDPRPTIYSGQVSFGLLLSAHSSHGSELATAASKVTSLMLEPPPDLNLTKADADETTASHINTTSLAKSHQQQLYNLMSDNATSTNVTVQPIILSGGNRLEPQAMSESVLEEVIEVQESRTTVHHALGKRQIFENRRGQPQRRQQQPQAGSSSTSSGSSKVPSGGDTTSMLTSNAEAQNTCGQVNPNALYAGMGAIWASHQANLVGDSQLAIGTYVYDSCNDLDVGQRQSVRIVSNLNAFQQTTCEAPRGSPISLTIAHGDNQLRAIQLLTSFRVPVITTREHFALEDYNQLTRDQRRFLFTTAPSSRHLAMGALKFSKRLVSHSTNSAKLPNQFYKMSPKNGLIVVSQNLPARFIAYLTEMIPREVNYEILYSSHPIDQIRSVESLESVLIKSQQGGSSSSSAESKLSRILSDPPPLKWRGKRSSLLDSDPDASEGGEYDSSGGDDAKMLSPTILMFITPSEAIDLVTRLRNDLAEVSKYYSLIVSTREDITPALRTIFHRGGARLCSGKAFYTVSPKPDDIGEFSRYFRDTVQMEGENSDHPLICEFAKHQSTSRINADLDDTGAEPVIKAVWSAAAAFKSVHRRECASLATSSTDAAQTSTTQAPNNPTGGRVMNSRQSNKSAHAECMVKMNKNMSFLVQKALKRLDVTINSTGLQALDGFRLKFDDLNELMTNKFSIRYINKECEITDIGHYTGLSESKLTIDQESFNKSLEGSMPDPWPVTPSTKSAPSSTRSDSPTTTTARTPSSTSVSSSTRGDSGSTVGPHGDGSTANGKEMENSADGEGESMRPIKDKASNLETAASTTDDGPSDEELASGGGEEEPRSRTQRKRSRHDEIGQRAKKSARLTVTKAPLDRPAPVTATTNARGMGLGVTDTEIADSTRPTRASSIPTTVTPMTTTISIPTYAKQNRKLQAFPSPTETTIKDWLPASLGLDKSLLPTAKTPYNHQPAQWASDNEQIDSANQSQDLKVRATTQAPTVVLMRSTLPESDGNADLELPALRSKGSKKLLKGGRSLDTAASTTTQETVSMGQDYVTAPSISKGNYFGQHASPVSARQPFAVRSTSSEYASNYEVPTGQPMDIYAHQLLNRSTQPSQAHDLLGASPVPLIHSSTMRPMQGSEHAQNLRSLEQMNPAPTSASRGSDNTAQSEQTNKSSQSRLRSHIKWIYSSWYALSILGANITGALLTLYVLTFLLMKNCDGSLDRNNQGVRSMHLLAIIIVFFGSTLFIVYPTPGLCLLRTSWHNFALVMLFGSLLVQAMQTRSLRTLGLGGRPNRVNQFLTLVFMVGVQVAFELQRWKYESANYLNFVNQYFGSAAGKDDEKKLMILNSAISDQFNPLNSFNDQVSPVSIQISEHYQSLLQDYCLQRTDDFIQSQLYLCVIVGLLMVFSASNRRNRVRLTGGAMATSHKLTGTLTSGKLVATQHEANLDLSPTSHFQFASQAAGDTNPAAMVNTGNIFLVTILSAFTYSISIVLHLYGQSYTSNRDLISSVTMVVIAFTALVGIFLPILFQIHRQESRNSSSSSSSQQIISGSLTRPALSSKLQDANSQAAFTLFPEFAPTGLRRLSSTSGDSDSGAGSRRTFAETRESRRNMGAALANLGPSADSLRSMGFYQEDGNNNNNNGGGVKPMDPALLNLKLNYSPTNGLNDAIYSGHQQARPRANLKGKGEKRLIMLDVDPCCPRHGIGNNSASSSSSKRVGDHR